MEHLDKIDYYLDCAFGDLEEALNKTEDDALFQLIEKARIAIEEAQAKLEDMKPA